MKVRRKIFLITTGCLAALIILGYAFSPYLDAFRANRNISIAGVKLLMTSDQVEGILGKGTSIGGFGAEFYEYSNSAMKIAFPTDGLLKGKAGWIEISEPMYSIYGIKPGDSIDKAKSILDKHGFTEDKADKNFFKRGSVWVYIFEHSVRISIEDWTIRGRIY